MLHSRTGWFAVLITIIGALTAVDVMPLLSTFLAETFGAKVAHSVGALLAVLGAVTAKFAMPQPTPSVSSGAPPAEDA